MKINSFLCDLIDTSAKFYSLLQEQAADHEKTKLQEEAWRSQYIDLETQLEEINAARYNDQQELEHLRSAMSEKDAEASSLANSLENDVRFCEWS